MLQAPLILMHACLMAEGMSVRVSVCIYRYLIAAIELRKELHRSADSNRFAVEQTVEVCLEASTAYCCSMNKRPELFDLLGGVVVALIDRGASKSHNTSASWSRSWPWHGKTSYLDDTNTQHHSDNKLF